MIFWLIVGFVFIIIGSIGAVILKKSFNDCQDSLGTIGTLMCIFGFGIGVALLLMSMATVIEYNEFLFRYNEVESYTEPNQIMIESINNQLIQYQAKKKMYGVFSLYPESVLNLEYLKVP